MNFEFTILDGIQSLMKCSFLDNLSIVCEKLGNNGTIWIILALLLLIYPKTRKMGGMMALALIADLLLCNILIKPLVARPRPCDINTTFQLLIERPSGYSFPSGHAAVSFAAVGALFFGRKALNEISWKKPLCIVSLILAIVISLTRLYLYVHFPTDVLAGVLVGILAGWIGYKIADVIANKISAK